jgi:hypothetical protein
MMLAAVALLAALQAQDARPITGRVIRVVGTDTLAVPGAMVLLHGVSPTVQGVIDSTRSDAEGRWRFRPAVDSATVLLVSARHEGIEYFAPPVARERLGTLPPLDVLVADLDPTAPVTITSRHVIVGGPAPDGTRDVVDLLVLRNASGRTRAMPDTAMPTWQLVLPPHAANARIGDADFAADMLDLHGDTLFLHAPIPPGDRQLFLQYQIVPASRRFEIPMDQPIAALTLMAEEEALEADPYLSRSGLEELEGRRFVRWTGAVPAGGAALALTLPGRNAAPTWTLPALIALFALLLGAAALRVALPRRGRGRSFPGS